MRRNHFKEDLKSLKRDYVALNKASKPQKLGKSSIKWRIEITTLKKELHQWKEVARVNKEKPVRA